MDIEAIRKRNELYVKYAHLYEADEKTQEAEDRKNLLDYISDLESRLRWRKVEEEKPPEYKELLVKRGHFAKPFVTAAMCQPYNGYPGSNNIELVWKYRDGASYQIQPNDEWRKI